MGAEETESVRERCKGSMADTGVIATATAINAEEPRKTRAITDQR